MREYLELDLMTLKGLSIEAGYPIDEDAYLRSLNEAKHRKLLFDVRSNGLLEGYVTLKDIGNGKWFILMFVVHPSKRNKHTFSELFLRILSHLENRDAKILVSNVFKVNKLSVCFHKKLGFTITKEAAHGYEFTMELDSPETSKIRRWIRKLARHS